MGGIKHAIDTLTKVSPTSSKISTAIKNIDLDKKPTKNNVGKAIKMVADYYGVKTIDLLHNSVINRQSLETILIDGVHPSLEGHKQLAQEISSKLPY